MFSTRSKSQDIIHLHEHHSQKLVLLTSLREFEIMFQMQHFKGNKFICIKTLVLFFGKNCAEEGISCYVVPNLGEAECDLY